jgi:hypothetical protein
LLTSTAFMTDPFRDVAHRSGVVLEWIRGHRITEGEALEEPRQQTHVLDEVPARERPRADHVEVAVHDLVRVDHGVARVGVLADDQVRTARRMVGPAQASDIASSGSMPSRTLTTVVPSRRQTESAHEPDSEGSAVVGRLTP